ncbi:hypothetical protein HanRHA438_Chr03g0123681 [Helianthus annuus]|uniref:Uncharacterized protein n=1 Tax=Helianthus annuus TaxID=4232 RepID=A0A9K3JG54_HELAN|nr:hypothetical protein HanXRQr2_Chr03g0111561 [Helianthus annuus]KAJ0600870.1 hypothetical protein HanIR_Chr03g0121971 [Helianthus annuus]KAJ0935807.1 hypothetical protein HanRHA438_Chr03g0123681 [Helianthus annuus]
MKRNQFLFVKSTHQSLLRSGAPHHKSYFMHTNTRYTCPINPHLPFFLFNPIYTSLSFLNYFTDLHNFQTSLQ